MSWSCFEVLYLQFALANIIYISSLVQTVTVDANNSIDFIYSTTYSIPDALSSIANSLICLEAVGNWMGRDKLKLNLARQKCFVQKLPDSSLCLLHSLELHLKEQICVFLRLS